jgi:membrane protein YqaA with SNARE-associated domain
MLINREKSQASFKMLFFSIVYLFICCFIFFLLASIAVDFFFDGKISLTKKTILDVLVVSTIAATAGGLGSWIFAKIDEHKAKKSPPVDRQ